MAGEHELVALLSCWKSNIHLCPYFFNMVSTVFSVFLGMNWKERFEITLLNCNRSGYDTCFFRKKSDYLSLSG